MTVVDCVLFDDEFDMLDCRLHQLKGVVDRFVVTEADHTFSGTPKPLRLTEAIGRYGDWPLEVIAVSTGDVSGDQPAEGDWVLPETDICWRRDRKQRDAALHALRDMQPDTVVMYGDLDEIPRREAVLGFDGEAKALDMVMFVYSTTLRHPGIWRGTIIGRLEDMASPYMVRGRRWSIPFIENGGWHLSWFGTAENRNHKLHSQSHRELIPKVGENLGEAYPAAHLHVDGETTLIDWSGDVPEWVAEGHAPAEWTKRW